MHNVTERFYIFSVFNSTGHSLDNISQHEIEMETLRRQGYMPMEVNGRYNGIEELSIGFYGTNLSEPILKELVRIHNQESFLTVFHDNAAILTFSDGTEMVIGKWKYVDEKTALGKESYSKIGNQWFIVE